MIVLGEPVNAATGAMTEGLIVIYPVLVSPSDPALLVAVNVTVYVPAVEYV